MTELETTKLTGHTEDFEQLAQLPIVLKLTGMEALCIIGNIQLASRHPKNTGPSANIAQNIARRLQVAISITPWLADMVEFGWHP